MQHLTGLIALCPTCHKVKHWGRSEVVGENMRALREHMMSINVWTRDMVDAAVTYEFEVWNRRNKTHWTLNLDYVGSIRASL